MAKLKKQYYKKSVVEMIKKELSSIDLLDSSQALHVLKDTIIEKLDTGISPKQINEFLKEKGITDITISMIQNLRRTKSDNLVREIIE